MNPNLLKILYQPMVKRAAISGLVGRNRDRTQSSKGRFTQKDVKKILTQTWSRFDQLVPKVPKQKTLGNQMNLYLSCVTFSCFQILLEFDVERNYAIELISDVSWKVYEKWGVIPISIAQLWARNPRDRMRFAVKAFLQFPFSPPGYRLNRLPSDDGISFDMQRCVVAEYFQTQGTADLCVGTWCDLDFALAEMWGGWLERTKAIAAGSSLCDFRFKANTIE
jgi:hypothetical protein